MSDEFNNLHYGSSGKEAGYYFQYSVLNSAEWNQRTRLRQVAQDIDKVIKDTACLSGSEFVKPFFAFSSLLFFLV